MTSLTVTPSVEAGAPRRGRPRKAAGAAPSPEQLRRLKFIEQAVLWTGRVGRRAVATTFDVSVGHVSQDFQRYRRLAPRNLRYDIEAQCYRPTSGFRPVFDPGNAGDLLATLAACTTLPRQERVRALGFEIPTAAVQSLPTYVDRDLLAALVRCIVGGSAMRLTYQSLETPYPVARTFAPHGLIFTGFRWLVRGWDERHRDFRDLAIARVLKLKDLGSLSACLPRDELWQEHTTFEIIPSPSLSASQVDVVAREYGMSQKEDGWIVRLPVRRAMVPYMLDYLGLRPGQAAVRSIETVNLRNYADLVTYDRRRALDQG